MTFLADSIPTGRDDPLYATGQGQLQKGEWEEAISTFEELQRRYPDSSLAQQALQQAQLHASIDAGRRVRARWTTLRFWPVVLRLAIIAAIGYLVFTGGTLLMERVQPIILQAQETQRMQQLLVEARAFLEAGDLSAAELRYTEILESEPANEEALQAMAIIEEEQLVETLYAEAVALDDAGDVDAAMESYLELSELRAGFRDIDRRMAAIAGAKEFEQLFAETNAAYDIGDVVAAIAGYEAVRERNVTFEQELVEGRLVELYFGLGDEIVKREPPKLEELSVAMGYFSQALSLDPRNQTVGRERQLLKLYLEGQTAYYEERWTDAAAALRIVYDTRPDYLGDTVLKLLYESYVRSGDLYREARDNYLAYEHYLKAEALPVIDKSFVEGRLFYVRPLLTPTPTPVPTATPRPAYAGPPATPRPLSVYKNKIAFIADYPNLGEVWVMDPDGTNRQRLGRSASLRDQFEDLEDQERYAPEGDRFAFVQSPGGEDPNHQIFITIPVDQRDGSGTWFTQLTWLDALTSDPVWSPDGSTIAFVSGAIDSDDIWVVNVESSAGPQPLTPNPWEWERHPTWSPESDRIVFWSNRNGLKQLYTMNADGSEVINISNTAWDEYDPIWIK